MYSTTAHSASTAMNGLRGDLMDASGSILPTPTSINAATPIPRGTKRSRSPDLFGAALPTMPGGDDDTKPRKRGRAAKGARMPGSAVTETSTPASMPSVPMTTPQIPPTPTAPAAQVSPPRPPPPKPMIKALPTVRDHTTDQVNLEGDEYIPRECDETGEKKVGSNGRLNESREYKCRTFLVPNRGDRLFMLATECARALGYRDSYLLFNKNRSLFKIIATQLEKDDLIHQEILPYSYRSRQIAIVTAKSMFRQFGSRVIKDGRRVRDDYWVAKAIKQGFTEEDMAGEKRPGGARAAREAQAAEAASAAGITTTTMAPRQDGYGNGPAAIAAESSGHNPLLSSALGSNINASYGLPMIQPSQDYSNVPRPRQEMTGQPYQDQGRPTSNAEMMTQATHSADYTAVLNEQQRQRATYIQDHYKQKQKPTATLLNPTPESSTTLHSPPLPSTGMMGGSAPSGQPMLQHSGSQKAGMGGQSYVHSAHHQPTNSSASPAHSHQMRPDHLHHHHQQQQQQQQQQQHSQHQHRSSSLSYNPPLPQPTPLAGYRYSQPGQMWGQPPPQPHQSPLNPHSAALPHYQSHSSSTAPSLSASQQAHSSASPHTTHSPHISQRTAPASSQQQQSHSHQQHPSQQASSQQQQQLQQQQPQSQHAPAGTPLHHGGLHAVYQGMSNLPQGAGYGVMGQRAMYGAQGPSPHGGYMPGPGGGAPGGVGGTSGAGGQGLQGWAPQGGAGWGGYQ